MKALSVAEGSAIFFKDRGAVLSLLLLPLVFVIVFSGALGAIGQGEEDARIPLPVVDLDGDESAQTLLDNIDAAGGVRVELYAESEAMAQLDEGEIDRVLTIPADFSAGLDGQPTGDAAPGQPCRRRRQGDRGGAAGD